MKSYKPLKGQFLLFLFLFSVIFNLTKNFKTMNRKEITSLLVSGLAITGGVFAASLTGGLTLISPVIVSEGLKAFGGLGGNLVANTLQKHLIDNRPQDDVLKNGDLTRAIGSAIFKLCGELATETYDKKDKESLLTLSKTDLEFWENLIIGGEYQEGYGLVINDLDLDEVSAEKAVQYVHAQADKLDEIKSLTPQTWKSIIGTLCNKIETFNRRTGCSLSNSAQAELADKLHKEFARALRKVLIDDFSKDGKAYASMQFRILGEILTYTHQNFLYAKETFELSDSILPIVIDLSKKIDSINQNSPKNYSPENTKDWDKIFADFDSFRETLNKTYQNTEDIKADVKKILENQQNQPKPSKPNPQGLINLPREKNDFFVEQSNIFSRLDLELTAHHLAYLHGTHGLGKTTTLVEYAFSRGKDYDFIVYVLATDAAIEAEMARFADEFLENVSAEDTPALKALKVKTYLEENALWTKESKNWLIIFDNLESAARISQYFPKTAKGDCLYACNEKLFIGNDREVNFEQFSQTEAELFVFQKMNDASEAKHEDISAEGLAEINKLVARLGRLPLSLNIATAYLVETKISIGDYVGLLKANVQKFLKYKDMHQASQHGTAFEAFLITLDKVSNFKGEDADGEMVGKLAENFLNLLIFCAPEDIPEELIKDTLFQTIDTSAAETPPNILFRETVALLKRYGLIKEKEKPFKHKEKFAEPKTLADGTKAHWEEKETFISVFDTYRTLQDILSVKLENEAKKSLLEQMLVVFNGLLPTPEVTTWEILEKYAVHAFPIVEQAEKLTISNENSWWVCNRIGFYFDDIAKYREAEYFYLRGKTIAEDFYGKEHENTATSYNNLALLYKTQGRYEEVEPLYKQALAIHEKVLGENHPSTATSYNNLAELYRIQDRYEEAEPLFKKDLAINEKVLGENHPDTAGSYNNLAELYRTQGRYAEAKPLYRQALAIREKALGENHPSTASSYLSLGAFYYERGQSQVGLELCEKALKICQKTLPTGHPLIQICEEWVEGIKNSMGK